MSESNNRDPPACFVSKAFHGQFIRQITLNLNTETNSQLSLTLRGWNVQNNCEVRGRNILKR
ncbi:CLUMA_CG009932, isoform A [Clunio marinus]|uniref:CLUMA_CG009932, isoform A n=1 Tax=Clunio marinus TaxID=568069 RepID=A0A1J1IB84_9DIPT|nr:CLUMA_CG009932, isoform A [Clunio marinus]